jgi:hypothetical protein
LLSLGGRRQGGGTGERQFPLADFSGRGLWKLPLKVYELPAFKIAKTEITASAEFSR